MTNETKDLVTEGLQKNLSVLEESLEKLITRLKTPQSPSSESHDYYNLRGIIQSLRSRLEELKINGQEINLRLQQMDNLVKTSTLITSSLHLDQVLESVIDMIVDITRAERVYLMLNNDQDGELTIRAARNWDKETVGEEDVVFSRTVIKAALKELKPIITMNAKTDVRFERSHSVSQFDMRSILCIPLELHGKIIGVLYADNRVNQDIFRENLIPILTAFANQATIAIENARLFGKVQADLVSATKEIERLQIEVDRRRVNQQVDEITETDYFQQVHYKAQHLRNIINGDYE
jgi:transcriptional regulator with GAF, ATPase, and Fis domain